MEAAGVSKNSEQRACLVDEMDYRFSFPIFTDSKTESYVKLSKILLIMQVTDNRYRNCVKKLKEKYKHICELCPDPNATSVGMSHRNSSEDTEKILEQVRQKCQSGINLVVVNSSLSLEHMRYLFYLSKEMGYVIIFEPWKQSKGVGSSLLANSFVNHLFFAWFLNERDSLALRQECVMYITDCVAEVKEFDSMMQRCQALSDLPSHYQFSMKAVEQELVFCATRFCGSSYVSSDKAIDYLISKGVYGQVTKLKVFGFIVTPFAIGAKVKLVFKQKELVDRHFSVDMCTYSKRRITFCKDADKRADEVQIRYSKCESTLELCDPKEYYDFERPYTNLWQVGILTLGYAKSKTAHDAAQELSDAGKRELHVLNNDSDVEEWSVGRSSVRRYGKCWMINLREMLTVNAILASEIIVK